MRAVSITGFKNSGKTTLTCALAQALEAMGLRVGIVKHTHHGIDMPHTDTALFSTAGRTVAAVHADQSAVFFNQSMDVHALLPLVDADIVLVEGGKRYGWLPRIVCLHHADEVDDLRPELAIASYGQAFSKEVPHFTVEQVAELAQLVCEKSFVLPGLDCGACGFVDCAGLAAAIVGGTGKSAADCQALPPDIMVRVNGQAVGLNPFVARMMGGALRGMLAELKGVTKGCKAELTITL